MEGEREMLSMPSVLMCPISHDRMQDPVILIPSGNTYDCEQICKSLLHHPYLDPSSGVRYDSKLQYCDNLAARQLLMETYGDKAFQKYDDSGFQTRYEKAWNSGEIGAAARAAAFAAASEAITVAAAARARAPAFAAASEAITDAAAAARARADAVFYTIFGLFLVYFLFVLLFALFIFFCPSAAGVRAAADRAAAEALSIFFVFLLVFFLVYIGMEDYKFRFGSRARRGTEA
jgi:hypothetical protein